MIRSARPNRIPGERGASLVEYALLLALIAAVCIAAVTFLGTSGSTTLQDAGDGINDSDATCFEVTGSHWFEYGDGMSSGYLPGPCP